MAENHERIEGGHFNNACKKADALYSFTNSLRSTAAKTAGVSVPPGFDDSMALWKSVVKHLLTLSVRLVRRKQSALWSKHKLID